MPEEKQEKKAAPAFSPAGEKKKESFTFSDKIKASKTAAPKSFANRLSSKIGKDGKPKQTIFERTKRDAPFLIAALVALLLLPFLYKYSGSVSDGPMITPSSEDSIFDPDAERYAFAPDADLDGQIAQLSGRDSLSLITGLGGNENEVRGDDYDYDYSSRDGFAGSSDSARAAAEDTNVDIEENTTNIYKKRAKAATRAAFKRAATKINPMHGATLRSGNGSKLGVGNWGGSLKTAARRVGSDGPKSSPKPVSLQPLRAAGTPSRSAFGNPAAAMRQAKDALSKADAKQGILDAMVKPVEPGRFGGMATGDASMGGAAGKMDRNFNFSGKEPWWWDLMKTRSQMEWQKQFERKWNWITWGDKLAQNILGRLINCLVTGDEDGEVGAFLGSSSSSSRKAECCGMDEKKWKANKDLKDLEFNEANCKANLGTVAQAQMKKECPFKWKGSGATLIAKGPIASRLGCLGLTIGGRFGSRADAAIDVSDDCEHINDVPPHYDMVLRDYARKWRNHTYHWVVARNYVPVGVAQGNVQKQMLCSPYTNNLKMVESSVAADAIVSNLTVEEMEQANNLAAALRSLDEMAAKNPNDPEIAKLKENVKKQTGIDVDELRESSNLTSKNIQKRKDGLPSYKEIAQSAIKNHKKENNKQNLTQMRLGERLDREDYNNACVIYVGHGQNFVYEDFKTKMVEALANILVSDKGVMKGDKANSNEVLAAAENAFYRLDLMFIEGMASAKKLGYARWFKTGNMFEHCTPEQAEGEGCKLPVPYWEFYNAYVLRYGTTTQNKGTRNNVQNRKFRSFNEGEKTDSVMGAKCYFDNSVRIHCIPNAKEMQGIVTFGQSYKGGDYQNAAGEKDNIVVKAKFIPLGDSKAEQGVQQEFTSPKEAAQADNQLIYTFTAPIVNKAVAKVSDLRGNVEWVLYRAGQEINRAVCPFNMAGDKPAATVEEKECLNKDQSAECCAKLAGPEYVWEGGKCVKKTPPPPPGEGVQFTRLAPVLSWIPETPSDRGVMVNQEKARFGKGKLLKKAQGEDNAQQYCGSQTPIAMDSAVAKAYVDRVVEAYNAKNPKIPLSNELYNGKYPTDAEFVDAMRFAQAEKLEGVQMVPAAAVCELGRDMVRMSQDKHTVGQQMGGNITSVYNQSNDSKNQGKADKKFHNDLGAFLVYIHQNAMLYPTQKVYKMAGDSAVAVCDNRFMARKRGVCEANPNIKGNGRFQYENYNRVILNQSIWNAPSGYKASLNKISPDLVNNPPLKELFKGKAIDDLKYEDCGFAQAKCGERADDYRGKVEYLLAEDKNFTPWEGKACTAFADESQEMSIDNVLRYVTTVCEVGLDQKPSTVGSQGSDTRKSTPGGKSKSPGLS